MQIQCKQVVLTPIVDEDVWDKQTQIAVCKALYEKRITFSGTVHKDGQTTKHDKLRITAIHDQILLDIMSIGSSHTLSMKKIPVTSLVSISITLNDPVDAEEAQTRSLSDILDISI
jgi:hypothetical protein